MANGSFKTPFPENEAVLGYTPGSAEKAAVKAELKRQKSEVLEIPLVIGGEEIFERDTDNVTIPHNHAHVIGKSRRATKEDVTNAINSALAARKEWAALPWEERAAVFLKAADLLTTTYRARLNVSTMLGQSKTVFQAEIEAACELADFLRFNAYFAQKIYEEQPLYSPKGQWNRSEARGLEGFVFAVGPFNFTAISMNIATAPALMGCTVVWKPSPQAMHASYLALKILEEAGLPKGVINMVSGDPVVIGDTCLAHPELSGIHFTGSTATFNHLWKSVASNIDNYNHYPRIVGETGGKDFVFAHESACETTLTNSLVRGAFEYQGQKCSAASRSYIPKSLWEKIKQPLIDKTNSIKMGDAEDFTNFMTAVIDERSFDKIVSYIEHAKSSSDAEIIAGGEYDKSKGYFVRPTIVLAKTPNYKSMVEEIFGPVLTIFVYDEKDFDKTLELCDTSTKYALTGSIFARDAHMIKYMSDALSYTAGNFYINDKPTGAVVGQQPFGGSRASGTNDKAGSIYNLLRWVSHRTIKENLLRTEDYGYPFMQET
jgi:1-pyrroline-5-carboxylate dehydrogenase